MRHVHAILALGLAACGGGPALKNVPHPDTATAAGVTAAAAAAATLADPNANRTPEKKTPEKSDRPVANNTTVPADVLDRLDATPADDVADDDDAPAVTPDDVRDAPPLPAPVISRP